MNTLRFFEQHQWLLLIVAVFSGLALGQIDAISEAAAHFILPFLMVMLFGVFVQIPFASRKKAFRNVKVAGLSLLINFVWTPLLAFGLSLLFFRDSPDVFIALIMDMVTPCTDWYLVFTAIAGGYLALSTALLPWNLLMQLILMPLYLFIFAGTMIDTQPYVFLQSFARVLVAPFIIAIVARRIAIYMKGDEWFAKNVLEKIGAFQASFLNLAQIAMFASQETVLIDNISLVIRLIIPVVLFFMIRFSVEQLIGRVLNLSFQEGASLIFTILARNASGDLVAIDVEAIKTILTYDARNKLPEDPWQSPQVVTALKHGLGAGRDGYVVVE